MSTVPLRFRRSGGDIFFADESGRWFLGDNAFLDRLGRQELSATDRDFLIENGFWIGDGGGLNETAFLSSLAQRLEQPRKLSSLILIPTLRCDLSCSYCQVSRAAIGAKGFDWSDARLKNLLALIDGIEGDQIQVEFQGGEPTLRLDLVQAVITHCRNRFSQTRFILCTNLSELSPELEKLIADKDVFVSTSLDGPKALHTHQRTGSDASTDRFLNHLATVCALAPGRVHALPTLDPSALPEPEELIDAFAAFDLRSIYLRPIVHHGFARKRHGESHAHIDVWQCFFESVIEELIARNAGLTEECFEEFYLSLALKRLLRPGENNHTDLRSPNWLGHDLLVVDYDGLLYPSDEARMLARIGEVDLAIGNIATGIDIPRRRALQGNVINALDPWCSECPYQAACGADPIDDIARYGRADYPRPLTAFCQKHMHLFDFALELLTRNDEPTQASIAHWIGAPSSVDHVRRVP